MESAILERLQTDRNKGELLELLLHDVLLDRGFTDVRRQLAGSQFGFDLAAHRQGLDGSCEVWKFECKNLASPVGLADVAPKLIYHLRRAVLDVFVIVSVKPLNNSLHNFLEDHPFPMRVEAWCDSYLEFLILGSPRARKRLGLRDVDARVTVRSPRIYPQRHPYSVNIVHQNDPPNAFDYVLARGVVVKAYASAGFRGLVLITNGSKSTFTVHTLTLQTLAYLNSTDRVLIVEKPMGLWEPVKLEVKPTIYPGSEVDLLEGKVLDVDSGSFGMILTLAKETSPGLYWLSVRAVGQVDGKSVRIITPQVALHVRSLSEDTARLWVLGRFYDSPANQLLALNDDRWERVREIASDDGQWTFLGSAPPEILKGIRDNEWHLRAVPLTQAPNGKKTPPLQDESKIVFSLGTPVDEEIYSVRDALQHAQGTDQASQILLNQLSRKEDRQSCVPTPEVAEGKN